ncbi:hypothetical protein CRM22_004020 [Opisthorchis felineus]|uniref:Uncharacterized protein n=1 Tax=Opisthorchis felineus TaxID=147828 RepID=A0A4S2LYA5_OPIFE|nr:hypothetical protein CRM22_004020 [Opisthorchis felineus]
MSRRTDKKQNKFHRHSPYTQILHTVSMHCKLAALITVVLSTTLTTNGDDISCYESIGCVVEGTNINILERKGCGACSKTLTHINGATCKMLGCEKTCEKSSAGDDLASGADTVSKILGQKLTIKAEKSCCYQNFCNSATRRSQGALVSLLSFLFIISSTFVFFR